MPAGLLYSWIVLWILLLPSLGGVALHPTRLSCVDGKFYAYGYPFLENELKMKDDIDPTKEHCQVEIEIAVVCDVNTVSMTGSVVENGATKDASCVPGQNGNTIICHCYTEAMCNYKENTLSRMLASTDGQNAVGFKELKECALRVLQEFYSQASSTVETTTNATIANATTTASSTPPPSKNKTKHDFEETFARFRPKDKKKLKYQKKYRSFNERYNLIYTYCFLVMTLIIIWQIRRYLVDRYDLQSDLSLWFEKKKKDEMLWVERFRESNRAYRREYTKAGDEYWTGVKKREKEAQKIKMAEWKDRYEKSGECARVESDGHPTPKDYSPAAIEKRAHDWASREERVTHLIQQADSDVKATIEAKNKAQEENNKQRNLLLGEVALSAETAASMRRRRHQKHKKK